MDHLFQLPGWGGYLRHLERIGREVVPALAA